MLRVLKLDQADEWDEIVRSFTQHDIHYLSAYANIFSLAEAAEPLLFYYKTTEMRAVHVSLQRDISNAQTFHSVVKPRQYYDLITPYGYGGFQMEGNTTRENIELLDEAYQTYCRKKRIVSEFVKFHPLLDNARMNSSLYDTAKIGETIFMKLESPKQIWNDLASPRRRVIRKAQKNGVEIAWGNSPELLKTFIPIYEATMQRESASDFFYFEPKFYQTLFEGLKHQLMFFYATYEGEIIAIAMYLLENHQMQYFLSGANSDYHHLSPTSYVMFEAATWGQANGFTNLHLGGGLASLLKYKQGFTKEASLSFEIGRKIFDREAYQSLIELRVNDANFDPESTFFPKYRA